MRLEDLYDREIARARRTRIRRARAKMYARDVLGLCAIGFAVCCVISIVIGSCTAEARYAAARARGAAISDALWRAEQATNDYVVGEACQIGQSRNTP